MSRISEYRRVIDSSAECMFCYRATDRGGVWRAAIGDVVVCCHCAPKLGLLAADALADRPVPADLAAVNGALERLETQFWRGLCLARMRESGRTDR